MVLPSVFVTSVQPLRAVDEAVLESKGPELVVNRLLLIEEVSCPLVPDTPEVVSPVAIDAVGTLSELVVPWEPSCSVVSATDELSEVISEEIVL